MPLRCDVATSEAICFPKQNDPDWAVRLGRLRAAALPWLVTFQRADGPVMRTLGARGMQGLGPCIRTCQPRVGDVGPKGGRRWQVPDADHPAWLAARYCALRQGTRLPVAAQ